MKDRKTWRLALPFRAWLLLGGILGPVVDVAGITMSWSNVTTVNLSMGEVRTFSNVDQSRLFRVIVPGTVIKEQDKIYFQISNISSSSKSATVRLYAKSNAYVVDNSKGVGIDTEKALVWERSDNGGSEQMLPENRGLQDVTYYLNVRDVSCTITFSRPMKKYEIVYKPGEYANETLSERDWMLCGASLKLKDAIFTRAGYSQTGWAKSDGGPLAYALGASYGGNVDVTLYPVWTPNAEPPTKPVVSVSTSGAAYISVAWSGGVGATSFNLFRSTSDTRPSSPFARNVSSPYRDGIADSGLIPGVQYYYWVEAVNSKGVAYSDSGRGSIAVALSLGKSTDSHAAGGGSGSVSVSANAPWMAMSDADWITFETKSGTGDGTLTYTVAANALTSSRTGMVIVVAGAATGAPATKTILVTQEGVAIQDFVIVDGVLTGYNGTGGAVTVPSGVTSIGECAFEGRYDLTSVEIPSGVTNIDYLAFYFCDGLTSVALPSSLTRIREGAFAFCEGLTSVTLPSSIAEIGVDAFANCSSLEVIYVSGNGDIDAVKRLLSESGLDVDQVIFDFAENPTCAYYRVAFKSNGGKGRMPQRPIELGRVVNLPSCTFKPSAGKRFVGWACSNGRRYDDGMLVFNLAQPGETVTMTAIWE